MNYGLYLAASGALTSLYRQDLVANNLANSNTIGFKPDIASTRQRLPERLENPGSFIAASSDPKAMLEKLGGGVFGNPTRISMKQGALQVTGGDLDIAIQGDGFLVISVGGDLAEENLRLTRDGRLALSPDGRLILATNGMSVLDENNQPITLDRSAKVQINSGGQIIQNDRVVATLRLTKPQNPADLRKVGHNLMRVDANAESGLVAASGQLLQGHLESSAADPITTLNDMITATKSVQANITMMQYHDQVIGLSINTLGRMT